MSFDPYTTVDAMPEKGSYRGFPKWAKEDFTTHGYLATYAIGECRCVKCVSHWDEWVWQTDKTT